MSKNLPKPQGQLMLGFMKTASMPRLPRAVYRETQALLARLLAEVVLAETEKGVKDE